MTAFVSARRTVLVFCLACSLVVVTGCKSNSDRKLANLGPEQIYKMAHTRLMDYDYKGAIKLYENLTARFPFTPQARQARLDLIYAYYRQGESESAIDAADTFIRENPTHPRVDYAWYIKGLVDFDKAPNAIEHIFHADLTKRPPTNARKSFEAFRTVVEQYPKSAYAYDAHLRMVYLRNRLANYEVHVADYYMRRGAYVGAAQRANRCIEDYDGAPATHQALLIMIAAYTKLGLNDRAEEVRQVYAYNFPNSPEAAPHKPWWKFWAATSAGGESR
jgi:outer membrane protein assembly factor BamD